MILKHWPIFIQH